MGWKTLKNCFQSVLTVSKTDMKPKTRVWIELKMEVLPQVLASLDLACTSNLYPCRFLKMTKNIKIVELLAFQILRRTSRSSDWLVVYLPLWKIWVSWDDYSRYMKKKTSHVPNHQPAVIYHSFPQVGVPEMLHLWGSQNPRRTHSRSSLAPFLLPHRRHPGAASWGPWPAMGEMSQDIKV
jgi:hypothetical protein